MPSEREILSALQALLGRHELARRVGYAALEEWRRTGFVPQGCRTLAWNLANAHLALNLPVTWVAR